MSTIEKNRATQHNQFKLGTKIKYDIDFKYIEALDGYSESSSE